MRVNFPDDLREPISEAGAYSVMNGVNTFYTQGSYNTTSLTPTVTPLLTLPQSKSWYSTAGTGALLDDARKVAKTAGYDTENYTWDIVTFTSVPGYNFGGLGYVHGKGVWLQSTSVGVTCHELGHNHGLWHANSWDTSANDSIIGPGTHVEYGNIYDTMGAASAGNNQFNAMHKNKLDWIPTSYVQNVTSNGVYRLFPFDVPNRVNGRFFAAKIKKDFQRDYWLEFRQLFKSNLWLQNGLLLNWSPWAESAGGTHLLDTTPGTPTDNDSKEDAALVIGRTFADDSAGVHITPVTRGSMGTNVFIDVQINLGAFPANHFLAAQMELDPTNAAPGTLIHFHTTATDADGDSLAYAWSFDDLTFSTNNLPWATKIFSSAGEHVVRCVVSDMKGGVASANGVVTIGAPTGFRISGRVTDENGLPLEGVRVDNGATNFSDFFGSYTDSNGHYIIAGVTREVTLQAVKYGFNLLPNASWANPISAPTATADFIAAPLPGISVIASTNAVPENSSATNYFTFIRMGNTDADLTVNFNLSGSARIAADFTLTPFQSGTNTVVIPAGTNRFSIPFKTVNDSLAEGPEMATVTILEDPTYVNGSLNEATITILDDDLGALSTVSVSATTTSGDNSAPENGSDSGTFVFTRTGSTQNELTVNYSVSGSATAGIDYQTLLGVIIIPAGQSSATVEFKTIDDTLVETNETVIVAVSSSPTYIASPTTARVTIIDDDLITVTIFPTSATAAEPSSTGRFTVRRVG
ncbi:MAG: Calx-beta domain-containing protein, partial [Limisphaerales bacterium]